MAAAEGKIKKLAAQNKRMERLRLALDSLRIFAGRLLIIELAFSAGLLVIYPLITFGLGDLLGDGMLELLRNPAVQKKILFVSNLVVAPVIAFAQTVRRVLPD